VGASESSDPFLEIVIVAFRGLDLLRSCLRSIEQFPTSRGRVLTHVVDNASGDGTPEFIEREFPRVVVHRRTANDGFSTANNMALRIATAPYILILNPDTELRPGVLDHLFKELDSQPDVGMIGCRLERLDGSFDHAAKRNFPTASEAIRHFLRFAGPKRVVSNSIGYHAPAVSERGTGDVDAINGAFMLVRRRAVETTGLFDEGYWMYAEDLDWCRRFALSGWRVRYDGRVTAVHVKGAISGSYRRLHTNWHFHRSMGRFYRKFDAGRSPILDTAIYLGILLKFVGSAARSAVGRKTQQAVARRKRAVL
jgi:GT2 family glycosyltransferase